MHREEILEKKTYKKEGIDLAQRVFYTLTGKKEDHALQAHRNSKAIAMLFRTLRELRTLSDEKIDEILLEVIS